MMILSTGLGLVYCALDKTPRMSKPDALSPKITSGQGPTGADILARALPESLQQLFLDLRDTQIGVGPQQ